jgi:hypothetical protein
VGNAKRVTEMEISVEMETTVTQYINFKKNFGNLYKFGYVIK